MSEAKRFLHRLVRCTPLLRGGGKPRAGDSDRSMGGNRETKCALCCGDGVLENNMRTIIDICHRCKGTGVEQAGHAGVTKTTSTAVP